jgi:hypothetical protein
VGQPARRARRVSQQSTVCFARSQTPVSQHGILIYNLLHIFLYCFFTSIIFIQRDFAGISADRVEQIEQQIKEDLLKEASNYNGNFLVHREVPGSRMIPCFEAGLSLFCFFLSFLSAISQPHSCSE